MSKLLLVVLGITLSSSAAWGQTPVVEGHVFDKHTGVPLEYVEINVSREGSLDSSVARPVKTDSNGFYSVVLPEGEIGSALQITATCHVMEGDVRRVVTNGFTHPVTVVDGVARRDLYLLASRKRSFSRCEQVFLHN